MSAVFDDRDVAWRSEETLCATTWMNRCVARLRHRDQSVTLLEADALARALWASPICRADSPEGSADKLLASHPLCAASPSRGRRMG
jgi:hypothetical protein